VAGGGGGGGGGRTTGAGVGWKVDNVHVWPLEGSMQPSEHQ
jgi:hypothetical protein